MGSKLPHTLRIIILFLRLAVGLNFLYLGISALFNAEIVKELHGQSFTGLYAWLAGSVATDSLHALFAWAFLVIGGCLILGLATRLVSIGGIVLVIMSYWPTIVPTPTVYELANVDVVMMLCLLILLFSNAGNYLGLDVFIHVHLPNKQQKK